MHRFLLIILLASLLSACGARSVAPSEQPLATPLASQQWTIQFSYTGGIAGFNRKLEINSSGQGTATDARTGKTAKVQLTSAQLSQLQKFAVEAVFQPATQPSTCADCFVYTIQIDNGSGTPFVAQMDDVSLESSGLSSLVEFMRNVTDNALK